MATLNIRLKIKPFAAPNHVQTVMTTASGKRDSVMINLGEVADADLSDMCDEFKISVLAKAQEMRGGGL